MATITVKDAAGSDVAIQAPLTPGRKAASGSGPVVLSNEDLAAINAVATALGDLSTEAKQDAAITLLTAIRDAQLDDATAAGVAAVVTALEGTLDVQGPLTDTELRANPLPVSLSGAATEAKQDAAIAAIAAPIVGRNFFEITPNDSADIATRPDGVFVGGAGTIEMQGTDDNAATFTVAAGAILPVSPTRVLATGTTATGLVGFTV